VVVGGCHLYLPESSTECHLLYKEPEVPVAQFHSGEYVRMRDVIMTSYKGQIGRVIETKPNPQAKQTLDKYCVRFADGETVEVWSIQLESVKQA
jgi:hypothetical protein